MHAVRQMVRGRPHPKSSAPEETRQLWVSINTGSTTSGAHTATASAADAAAAAAAPGRLQAAAAAPGRLAVVATSRLSGRPTAATGASNFRSRGRQASAPDPQPAGEHAGTSCTRLGRRRPDVLCPSSAFSRSRSCVQQAATADTQRSWRAGAHQGSTCSGLQTGPRRRDARRSSTAACRSTVLQAAAANAPPRRAALEGASGCTEWSPSSGDALARSKSAAKWSRGQ